MHRSLFVGNIAYGALESEIQSLFSNHGSVKDVHFVMDYKQGRFRGFGFVRMAESDADEAVSKLNGTEFQGRRLIVREARENDPPSR